MLALPDGEYGEGQSEALHWREIELPTSDEIGRTMVWTFFVTTELSAKDAEAEKSKQARLLVGRINRLIRWYRVVSSDTSAAELSVWKGSPFSFYFEDSNKLWAASLSFSPPPRVRGAFLTYSARFAELSQSIKNGFGTGKEPPVSGLFLLDARQALEEGRFREAILFSWSTIDATFNIFYRRLADRKLAKDWSDGLEFIKGNEFGLRHKMSVGLNLLAGKSLFAEPGEFWARLSTSYYRRNKIIHEGQNASEDDASASVTVAEQLVRIVQQLAKDQNIEMPS
jgi:hypothetical protein